MSKNKRENTLIAGLFIGSAVGTIAGLLLAPRQGKKTRALLKKSLDALPEVAFDLSTTTQQRANNWSKVVIAQWDGTVHRLQKALASGIEASKLEENQSQPSSEALSQSFPKTSAD